ncbi:MAG: CAP domain-containing protein [Robiginitalea sp.]
MNLRHALLVLTVIFSFSCTKESPEKEYALVAHKVPGIENELLDMVNQHRASMGQKALSFSEVAYKYASSHTDYMIEKGTISHDNFNNRASLISREENAMAVSENLAKGYKTAKKALDGWLSSESHRKTVEGNYSHTAISVKRDAKGTLYFVQLFYLK